jgi:hypothetical protein
MSRDIETIKKDLEEAFDNLEKDSYIPYFTGSFEKKEEPDPNEPSTSLTVTVPIISRFKFSSENKKRCYKAALKRIGYMKPPYIVLMPAKHFSINSYLYPIMFHNLKVYIVPYIRDIIVMEDLPYE